MGCNCQGVLPCDGIGPSRTGVTDDTLGGELPPTEELDLPMKVVRTILGGEGGQVR